MARNTLFYKPNFSDPFMKALKAVNSIGGNSLTEEDLKRQRTAMERAGRLASPSDGVDTARFKAGGIKCEMVSPVLAHNPRYVIMYAHGGGYTCGGLSYARILAAKLAISTGFSVASFEYRLSPENKYPAPIDDGERVLRALYDRGYDADHILFAGDSAGGNLVLCLMQRMTKLGEKLPAAALLFSPWTDMTATSDSYEEYADKDPILTKQYIIGVRDAFIGTDADASESIYSPINGNFAGFPPTLIQVGRNEILLSDSVNLAKRIGNAGGKATLDIEEDGWHVYQQMPLPIANRAMVRLAGFVSDTIYLKETIKLI